MADTRRRLHLIQYQSRRLVARHRRMLAALLAGLAVLCLVNVLAPPPPQATATLVAAHDLTGGGTVSADDLRVVTLPSAAVPDSALSSVDEVTGRTLAGPVAVGETMTEARLVSRALVSGFGPERVAAPVRVADADAVRLLDVGDRIDVYAATASGDQATTVVQDAPVVTIPLPGSEPARSEGALVVLAVTSDDASRLAQESSRSPLSVTLRG